MRTNRCMLVTAVVSAVVSILPSCRREEMNEKYRPSGSEIEFGASTSYQNSSETRTVYSGEVLGVSSNRFERIDWENEDRMTIEYNQSLAEGTYRVTGVSKSAEKSYADVESVNRADKLVWGSGASHVFYAMYPENEAGRNTLTHDGKVTGVVPATQSITYNGSQKKYLPDMDYGYLVAYADNSRISGSRVSLPFTPATTAFEFRLQRSTSDGDVLKLKAAALVSESSPLSGTFSFQITGGNDRGAEWDKTIGPSGTSLTDTGRSVSVSFPGEGESIPLSGGKDYLDFTLFALPVELTNLALVLTYGDGTQKSLALKDAGTYHTFSPCRKYIVTNTNAPGENWEYTLGELQPISLSYLGGDGQLSKTTTFQSYRTKNGVTETVDYKLQYSLTGAAGDWSDTCPTWFSVTSPTSYHGSTTGETLSLTMDAQVDTAPPPMSDEHTLALYNATPAVDVDLSLKNVATGASVSRTTANCYVVQASGTYKFPVVYGNGVVNGTENESAYRAKAGMTGGWRPDAGEGEYLGRYPDHLGNGITSPYIVKQHQGKTFTAKLLWTDSENLVTNVSLSIPATGTRPYENAYISFEVPRASICQGNALIAVFADGVIAWSWHIWITDENLTKAKEGFSGYKFCPVDLGYCDTREVKMYARRSYYVRAVQTLPGGKTSASVKVEERPNTIILGGNSMYYEWGRKDPLQPGLLMETVNDEVGRLREVSNKPYYPSESTYAPQSCVQGKASIPTTIRTPYAHYTDGKFPGDANRDWNWCDVLLVNNWNSTANEKGNAAVDIPVTKTVYDPSPVGYKCAPMAAFVGLSDENLIWNQETLPPGATYVENGLFFAGSGYRRDGDNDGLRDVGTYGGSWYATPGSQHWGAYFRLRVLDYFDVQPKTIGGFRMDAYMVRPVVGE